MTPKQPEVALSLHMARPARAGAVAFAAQRANPKKFTTRIGANSGNIRLVERYS
jgi:hypothetical protein